MKNTLWEQTEAVLLTSPHNLQYFTGFTGGEGLGLLTERETVLFVDSRYTESAKHEVKNTQVLEFSGKNKKELLSSYLQNYASVGYEDEDMTVAEFSVIKEYCSSGEWIGVSGQLSKIRMIKTEEELSYLCKAESIGVSALSKVIPMIHIGVTEFEIAAELEYQMRKLGGEGTSFEIIAVSGYRSGFPHGKPSEKKLESGDFLTLDFGCIYHGYCSDMTRTFGIGKLSEEQIRIYDTVKKAQEAGLSAIKAGVSGKDADQSARAVIENAGYGKYFGHSLGHGVGLLIHELPNLSPMSEVILQSNMVVTCEPGIYIPDLGGVRIEDMVCVTEDGIENMTAFSKELLILG